ncbi:hypothetical protein BU14_0084s0005 [Porphyra umbilicalis]|uniref:Mediator of RNA polymerase II transcription subunit 10 n=1 Tax=Porphyra umbilicalis TaxID=2786 RepID=A0A1X6PE99_PORUM|nr:hypothetical protein BU14_0084s0005 [Porphyra umbilicalis]|eukprot:OSX79192.1 hypothetical protein BU14_0084s0005 [Porphyra umbilicalis]
MDANRSPGSSPPGGTAGGTDATRGGVKRRASAAPAMLELESALEVGADSLAGLVGAVSSFGVDGQADLFAKVNDFVKDLRQIDAVGATIPDTVPLDVLVAVDRGRNPEAVTKETLETLAEANDMARGKIAVMAHFRDELTKAMAADAKVPRPP